MVSTAASPSESSPSNYPASTPVPTTTIAAAVTTADRTTVPAATVKAAVRSTWAFFWTASSPRLMHLARCGNSTPRSGGSILQQLQCGVASQVSTWGSTQPSNPPPVLPPVLAHWTHPSTPYVRPPHLSEARDIITCIFI